MAGFTVVVAIAMLSFFWFISQKKETKKCVHTSKEVTQFRRMNPGMEPHGSAICDECGERYPADMMIDILN